MTIFRTKLLVTCAASAVAASPGFAAQTVPEQARAQATNEATAAEAPNAPADETIVVTAQKRTQILIDVPQSVSVVSGKTLEKQNANTFADYLKLVPGLQLDQSTPGEGRLIVRGVNAGGVASTVGVYVDETPFGSSSGLVNGGILAGDFDTFDLNRIEVLRGPQGTIYGASSLSGVVKFVTNLPSTAGLEARGRVGIEVTDGGDMGYSANAMVNIPLGDTLAFRASGSYRKTGGFIDSIGTGGSDTDKNINDSRSYGGRGSLLFKPSDTVSFRLTAIAQNIEADASSIVESDEVSLKPLYGRLSQSQFVPNFTDIKYRVYNATGTIGLGFADLTSSTSYSTQKQDSRTDYTNSIAPLLAGLFANEIILPASVDSKKFTQEVRLSGETTLVDWLVGGYYTKEKGSIIQDIFAVEPGTLKIITLLGVLAHVEAPSKYRELAGFADATFHVTPSFDVEIGGRYSGNKQSFRQVSEPGALSGASDISGRSSDKVFTYSLAPKFKFNKNATIYARVAKGFRPGGPNIVPPSAPAGFPTTYKSDSVLSYEVGVKAVSPDRRFSIDAAAFHLDWKDIQLADNFGGFGYNANGGKAKIDGLELTGTARPTRGLDLSANVAYTNSRLSSDIYIGGRKGERLPFSPKLSFALNGDYQWALGGDVLAHVGASFRHVSSQIVNYDRDFVANYGRNRKAEDYDVIDLMAGVDFGRFSLEAYVKNLDNTRGITSITPTTVFGGSPDTGFPIYPGKAVGTGILRPRTIGLSLTAGL